MAHSRQIVPIFSGGGTRFPAHIGCLKALEDMQLSFASLVGVSGGAIIAALYACGFTPEKMRELAESTDFRQFADFSLLRLVRTGGLSTGDKFEQWLDVLMGGVTFSDLDLQLHILATDLNGGGPVLFNRSCTPDMKVSQAVRYSMSIPLIFAFKKFDEQLLVDGAILSEDALFEDWQKDGTPSICFRLKSDAKKRPLQRRSRFPLPAYIMMLVRTFMAALSREYVHAEYWQHTIVINTGEISAVDFNASAQAKSHLFEIGYETTRTFLPRKLISLPDAILRDPPDLLGR